MTMKKIATILTLFMLTFLIPTAVFASNGTLGAGEWDYLGSDSVYANGDYNYTDTFYSGGGNLKVCVSNFDSNSGNDSVRINLYNYNPNHHFLVAAHDEQIGSDGVACKTFTDLSFWVDGSNNKAEFKFVIEGTYSSWNPEWVTVKVWD
ncbi:hypothetical protein SAMN05216243_2450 [Sediminibacillus albus]|uniref:Uncharacterized protein n=2 Tax=Sediminibacillus albus TaxID=407036 RepID=A0A1G9A944_9BACI|nr:hypothetical protein SAMN05216243_2450 [Sediminibacillus albus]